VVKSTLGSLNNIPADLGFNEEKVKTGLTQIKNYLESFTSENREKLNLLTAKVIVEGHISNIRAATNMLQRTLDMFLQSVFNARKWILQPQIISPKLIMNALFKLRRRFLIIRSHAFR
jgi:hypothetical protein